MNTAYLSLGTNKGNKEKNLDSAINIIENRIGELLAKSSRYITQAWGNEEQPDYINQVICVKTNLSAIVLLKELLLIEKELGRIRTEQKWTERTMDIDILFYNNEIIETADLKIPHHFIEKRMFVLKPLVEIAKGFIHPFYNKSIEKLLEECKDKLDVERISD